MLNERLWKHGLFVFIQLHIKRRDFMKQEMSYKQSNNAKLIEKFAETELGICKVEYDRDKYAKAAHLASSLTLSAKRYGKPHIRAMAYKNNVYLVNKLKG